MRNIEFIGLIRMFYFFIFSSTRHLTHQLWRITTCISWSWLFSCYCTKNKLFTTLYIRNWSDYHSSFMVSKASLPPRCRYIIRQCVCKLEYVLWLIKCKWKYLTLFDYKWKYQSYSSLTLFFFFTSLFFNRSSMCFHLPWILETKVWHWLGVCSSTCLSKVCVASFGRFIINLDNCKERQNFYIP